jgi:DNA-binding CsgD family transcriptional regulator
MERLRPVDFQKITAFLAELYELADVTALRQRLLSTLPTVVPADRVSVIESNPRLRQASGESLPGGAFDARHGALPPSIVRWIRRQTGRSAELPRAREPFVMTRDATQLVARIVSRGAETLVVLEEQHRWIPPAALRSLGLTRRETEVLAWVAEGKTSAEIANILGTGRRAIEKHLEHIYPKLGVETRTAAAARALAQLTNSTRPA